MSSSRTDAATGFATILVRDLQEHACSKPPDNRTPGVVIWGTDVYRDGALLGRVDRVHSTLTAGESKVVVDQRAI